MISRMFRIGLIGLTIAFGLSAFGQLKIAAVSVTGAIFGTENGAAMQEEWKIEFQPEVDKLTELDQEVKSLSERYRRDVDILTETEKATLEFDITTKSNELQNRQEQLNTVQTNKAQLYLQEKFPIFEAVLNDLISVEGYDAVFRLDNQVHNFLYLNPKHVITAKVIEKLNERMDEELPDELTGEPDEEVESVDETEGGE